MRLADADLFRIPVGPGAVHVERYGYGGRPVLLLHGFGTSSFLWRRIAPELAVNQHTAFAIDLFGYGASDRPFGAEFGIRAQASYIRAVIGALGIPQPLVVGCDMGALVALRLASDAPESVGGLVLVSPADWRDAPGAHIRSMQRATARHVVQLVRGLFGAEPLIRELLQSSVIEPLALSPRLVGRFVAPFVGSDGVDHLLALARSLETDETSDLRLSSISHATTTVRGTSDRWCTEDYALSLVTDLPHARFLSVPDTGRLVTEENPGAVVGSILSHDAVR